MRLENIFAMTNHHIYTSWFKFLLLIAGLYFIQTQQVYAYPSFQFSTDNSRCNLCHYSPTGGGLINQYGRDESSDTISRYGGDGDFLHGAWTPPDWIDIGGDFRGAVAYRDSNNHSEAFIFPMQMDIYSRIEFHPSIALSTTIGVPGRARNQTSAFNKYIFPREYYLLWQPHTTGSYVRAGRFAPPFGLRVPDHTNYIRRYMGLRVFEEPYTISTGHIQDKWELHLAAFMQDPLFKTGPKHTGGTLLFEQRLGRMSGWGLQSRITTNDQINHYTLGATGKTYFESLKLLILAEIDTDIQTYVTAHPMQVSTLGHLSFGYFPTEGLLLESIFSHYDENATISNTERNFINLSARLFPYAHYELHGFLRWEHISENTNSLLGMFMFHYYL